MLKSGQNNKKKIKMHVTSFSSKFDGHTFISLKVISALQKKEKEGSRKKYTKRKIRL